MLWTSLALATPTAPTELSDAALEASGVIAACREAFRDDVPCVDRTILAEAAVVQALASLVNDGEPDLQASIDAWSLAPEVARGWIDLIGQPTGAPSAWVAHALGPQAAPPPVPAAPPPPKEPIHTAPIRAERWWSAATSGVAIVPLSDTVETGAQRWRGELTLVDGGFMARFDGVVGRTTVDLTDVLANIPSVTTSQDTPDQVFRYGRFEAALGYTFRRTVQVTVGPSIGSEGFDRRSMAGLIELGVQPTPTPYLVGTTLRTRARVERSRVAGMFEIASGYQASLPRTHYASPLARAAFQGQEAPVVDPQHHLLNTLRIEVQLRTVARLWTTVGLRADASTRLANGNKTTGRAGLEAGARWW